VDVVAGGCGRIGSHLGVFSDARHVQSGEFVQEHLGSVNG
jgi:hypothetical protein